MDQLNNNIQLKTSRLHARYIICILTGIIVSLIAINWSSVNGLPEMINMALALSSLILAGLAIVYSFLTSGSLNKTLDKIEESSQSIKQTSINLEESNAELSQKVESIPIAIESVKEKVDESHKVLQQIPRSLTSKGEALSTTSKKVPDELSMQYLKMASIGTLDGLMIFKIAHEKRKMINYIDIMQDITSDYLQGMITSSLDAINGFNLADTSIHTAENKTTSYIEVKSMEQPILTNLEDQHKITLEYLSGAVNAENIFGLPSKHKERVEYLKALVEKHGISL